MALGGVGLALVASVVLAVRLLEQLAAVREQGLAEAILDGAGKLLAGDGAALAGAGGGAEGRGAADGDKAVGNSLFARLALARALLGAVVGAAADEARRARGTAGPLSSVRLEPASAGIGGASIAGADAGAPVAEQVGDVYDEGVVAVPGREPAGLPLVDLVGEGIALAADLVGKLADDGAVDVKVRSALVGEERELGLERFRGELRGDEPHPGNKERLLLEGGLGVLHLDAGLEDGEPSDALKLVEAAALMSAVVALSKELDSVRVGLEAALNSPGDVGVEVGELVVACSDGAR